MAGVRQPAKIGHPDIGTTGRTPDPLVVTLRKRSLGGMSGYRADGWPSLNSGVGSRGGASDGYAPVRDGT
jgi:hypothetical protein